VAITRQRAESSTRHGGLWSRLRRSLTQLEADQVAEQVEWASSNATPMAQCSIGERVCVEGLVRAVTLRPLNSNPTVEIDLFDGTSSVTVSWIGRRKLPGITPGRRLVVHGRLAGSDVHPVIFNPRYELRPGVE